MRIEVGPVGADELDDYRWLAAMAFALAPDEGDEPAGAAVIEPDRLLAARHDGRMVGTAGAYSFELTVPGGATVPAAGVSEVTVAATHRRRGILSRIMARQFDDIVARGEPLAVLNASEAGIYGRFGYGLASLFQTVEVATAHGHFAQPVPAPRSPLRRVRPSEAAPWLAPLYREAAGRRPGTLSRSLAWWDCVLGPVATWKGGGDLHVVVLDPEPIASGHDPGGTADADPARSGAGLGGGYALYTVTPEDFPVNGRAEVREVVALDAASEAVLWRYLLDLDLVSTVRARDCPMDLGLRWWLADARQARVTRVQDFLWVRILDVVAALETRGYSVATTVVLDITDDRRPDLAGRYRLETAPDGATCTRLSTTDPAPVDVTLGIADLGAIYLGGTRLRDLAAAGRVFVHRPDGLDRADAAFSWPVAPHCTTRF